MAKSKANKSGFILLTVPAKIIYSRDRVVEMTGNPNFVTPSPSLATVTTVTDDLETKELAAEGGGTAQTIARDAAELVWDDTMRQLADYVDLIAQGNTVIISSAGFTPTSTERQPTQPPVKPLNLILKRSEETGAVFFSCDPVPDAESYVAILSTDVTALDIAATGTQLMIELNAATPAPFAAPPPVPAPVTNILLIIDVSSQRKKTIRGLTPATRIYGKMYCTNTAGRGPDSDVNSIMVA